MKNIVNLKYLVIFSIIVLSMPVGIVFAGQGSQFPSQVVTPTVPTSVIPTIVPGTLPDSPLLPLFQIPGLLQENKIIQIPDSQEIFTFKQFGLSEDTLRGPFSTGGYYFDLPLSWKMKQGAMLHLVLDVFYSQAGLTSDVAPNSVVTSNYIGTLEVQYNYETIGSVDLNNEGRIEVDIPIPLDVINSYGSNTGHSLLLILNSGINCNLNTNTTITIRSISQIYLPHDLVEPSTDLRQLPSPFYQDSFNQNVAVIVIPNQPSAEELQAALSVSAGFGSLTFNNLLFSLLPISQVNDEILASTNLIFIGKASGLPLLQEVLLSSPLSENGLIVPEGSSPSDGFVQLAISPWNKTKVVLFVGGNDDNGVIKAARAVSTGKLQVDRDSSLSVVADVQLTVPVFNPTDVNQTFADLGYDSSVVDQAGLNALNYKFYVPQSYTIGPDAYLDLNFSHTTLLEYQRSTVIVSLNGQPVGSVRLSDETAGQGNAKIFLPASASRTGENNLSLEIDLEPSNECVNPILNGLWMRIDSSSTIHLPYIPITASTNANIDLSNYPYPFAFDPIMRDIAFVLSKNDPVGWNVAAQLASQLGNINRTQLAGLEAFYSDSIPDVARQERNMIIVGRPSTLNVLLELKETMPLSFEPGADYAEQKNLQVSYRLNPGVDVGYLELIAAPWNSERNILYVGGSTDLGVRWAGATMQFGRLRSQLNGNLAFVSGEQVVTLDTRTLQLQQENPIQVGETPTELLPQQPIIERPTWIMPIIIFTVGIIILVVVLVATRTFIRGKSGKTE